MEREDDMDTGRLESIREKLNDVCPQLSVHDLSAQESRVSVPGRIRPDRVITEGGRVWLQSAVPGVCISCDASIPGAESLVRMAGLCLGSAVIRKKPPTSGSELYRQALTGELSGEELRKAARNFDVRWDAVRRVITVFLRSEHTSPAFQLLRELTPIYDRDVMVEMDRDTVVLILSDWTAENVEEAEQFAEALLSTLMTESALSARIGIARSSFRLPDLRQGYQECRDAVEIGDMFHPDQSVFIWDRQLLERFVSILPPEITRPFMETVFGPNSDRCFNTEMMETIDVFFRKDLNLADTSRYLQVHRNTLAYRLEKVQKTVGLDLRHFDDAVLFKILMEARKLMKAETDKES